MGAVKVKDYMLKPGYIYVTTGSSVVRTVLGSCVAVCLWDKNQKHGGMNHFLYPKANTKSKPTAQYGNVATRALIRMMADAGSYRKDMVAQIFGGGYSNDGKGKEIGEENVHVARSILADHGINVISEDVGGQMGRKIIFDTSTGHVVVFKVHKIRETDWITGASP